MSVENPRDMFASDPRVSTQAPGKDMFEGMKEPEEGSIFDVPLGVGEAGLALGTGMANWMLASAMKAPFSVFKGTQALLGKETAVEEGAIGREAIQEAVNLMVPAFEPKTEVGQKVIEPVSKAIEFVTTPARVLEKALTKRGYGNAGYLAGLVTELAIFKGLHVGGKKAAIKVKERVIKRKLKRATPEDLTDLKEILRESEPELAEFVDFTELIKKDVGELGMEAFPEAKITPYVKPERPKDVKAFEREHFRRTQAITDRLNRVAKDARESGRVLTDKNKSDMRRAREEIKTREEAIEDAKALREDARQVPPRRRDVVEEGKREGREDLQRIEEERRAEAKPEALEVGGGEPPKSGLVVANIGKDGKIYYGNNWEFHSDIQSRYPNVEFVKEGFTNKSGRYLSKEEAVKYVDKDIKGEYKDVVKDKGKLEAISYFMIKERVLGKAPKDLPQYRSGTEATSDGWVLSIYSKKETSSLESAQKKLSELEKKYPDMDLGIVKTGKNTYRTGVKPDPKVDAQIEVLAEKNFGEESMPSGTNLTKGAREAVPEYTPKMEPEAVEARATELMRNLEADPNPNYRRYLEQADPLSNDSYAGDSKYINANDAVDALVSKIRREGNLQKPNNVMKHPIEYRANKGSEIVLNDNLEAFKSPFEAANYAKEKGIDGRAWEDPDLGWVVERGGEIAAEIQAHKEFKWYKGTKSYYELLKRILKSQKGAIEIERLSTKQKESIRRFATRSIKSGMDMEEYLVRQGIDPKGARDLKVAAMALDQKRSITDPYVTDFETGEVVSTKTRGKMRGMELGRSKVYAGERDAIFKGEDLISRTFVAKAYRNPIRSFMEAGPEVKRMFYDRYIDIENVIMSKKKAFLEESKAMRKTLSFKEAKDVGLYLIAQQEGGVQRLANTKKYRDAKIPERLSEKQQKVADWTKEWFDRWFEEANEMKESIGKKPMKKEEAYFTFMQALTLGEKLGLKTNIVLDSGGTIRNRMIQWKDTPFRFAKRRVKGKKARELDYTLDADPFHVIESYGMNVIDHIEMSPLIAKIAASRRALKQEGTNRRIMLRNEKPNLDNFLYEWSNHLAGRQYRIPRLDRALRALNKNLAFAILGANARTAAIQVSALRNTNALVGTASTFYGLEKAFTRGGWREAFNKSKVLDLRLYQVSIEQAMNAIVGRRLGRAKQLGAQASMWPMKIMDIHAAVATWHGGLRMAKKMVEEGSLHKSEIHRYADDVVIRTQASGLRGDLAPIQRTALGKTLSLFQTFVINDWNFFHEEVLGLKNPKITSRMAARRMIRYVAGTMLINTLMEDVLEIKSPFPRPIKMLLRGLEDDDSLGEISATVFRELLEPIPVMSSLRYGSHPLGATVDYLGSVGGLLSRDPFKKEWYDLVARGLGIYGTAQAGKIVRGAKRDAEIWEMVFGSVERPTRGRGGGGLGGLKGLKGL